MFPWWSQTVSTHCPLRDLNEILDKYFRAKAEVPLVKLPSDECNWTLLMIASCNGLVLEATSHYLSQSWPRSMSCTFTARWICCTSLIIPLVCALANRVSSVGEAWLGPLGVQINDRSMHTNNNCQYWAMKWDIMLLVYFIFSFLFIQIELYCHIIHTAEKTLSQVTLKRKYKFISHSISFGH